MPTLQDRIPNSVAMTELDEALEDNASPGLDPRVKRHREMLFVACAVCLLAFLLHEVPEGRVAMRGLSQFPLPETCALRMWLNLRCPGCGLTRSIIHLAEGDWQSSWHAHRLGSLLAAVIAFQIPYRIYAIRKPMGRLLSNFWLAALGYVLIAALIVNWLFDLAADRLTLP
jgi:hypothetical protein